MKPANNIALADFTSLCGQWLRARGADSDVVISSRIRLARNLRGFTYPSRMKPNERAQVIEMVSEAVRGGAQRLDLDGSSSVDRAFLVERRLISKELAHADGARSVIFGRSESVSVMINEEDHLRVQCLRSGFSLDAIWRGLSRVDRALEQALPFQFHDRLGYLTACPSNVGTGMRVSVMVHLPVLVLRKELGRVARAVESMNLTIRGLYGEGTQPAGDFFQISNQATLGRSEAELLAMIKQQIPHIVGYERGMRAAMMRQDKPELDDKVARAMAALRAARKITVDETMSHLSMVRLGLSMGLVRQSDITLPVLNDLLILSQPAHLQKQAGRSLTPDERDVYRADLIRGRLGG